MDIQGILNDVYSSADHALRLSSSADKVYFGAAQLATIAGTPGTANTNGVFRITFPDAATTTVGFNTVVPGTWTTFSVNFLWTVEAGTGNVRWQGDVKRIDLLIDNISEAVFATGAANDGAPAAGVVSFVTGRPTGVAVGVAGFGQMHSIQISRIGADAGDTLSGAAAASICLAWLERVS